jgi:hypothetical protein
MKSLVIAGLLSALMIGQANTQGTGLQHLILRPKCKAFNKEIAKRE